MTIPLALLMALIGTGPTIVIDPGHPSENGVGTRGKKLTEVHVAWVMALELRDRLAADGYTVLLTKSSEGLRVSNRRRAEIANQAKAALLVRLHCDAASGTGIAVYYPSRQGKVGQDSGPSVDVRRQSAKMAKAFHGALIDALVEKLADRGLMTDQSTAIGARQGALTGSIYAEVPVILVELCVLTNPKDEAFVVSKDGRDLLADALEKAVRSAVPLGR
jgi:N-acetylmuramoyl-L-alanine amidase